MWPTFYVCGLARGNPDPYGCWNYIVKQENTDRSSATASADDELSFVAEPNTLYHIIGFLEFSPADNTGLPGHKMRLACTEAVNAVAPLDRVSLYIDPTRSAGDCATSVVAYYVDDVGPLGTRYVEATSGAGFNSTEVSRYFMDVLVVTGDNGGTISIEWGARSATVGGSTRLKSGSYLVAHKVTNEYGYVTKSSDTSRTTNTEQLDPDLQFSTVSGAVYNVRGIAAFRASTTAGASIGIQATGILGGCGTVNSVRPMIANRTVLDYLSTQTECGVCDKAALLAGTPRPVEGYGNSTTYVNGAAFYEFSAFYETDDSGTFGVTWAQDDLSATDPCVLLAGASLIWQKVMP